MVMRVSFILKKTTKISHDILQNKLPKTRTPIQIIGEYKVLLTEDMGENKVLLTEDVGVSGVKKLETIPPNEIRVIPIAPRI